MTVAKNADVAGVQEALVAERVQRELQAQAKLSGLFRDYSELVGKGTSSLKVPRADSFAVQTRDNATPAEANPANLTFAFDEIILDQSKYVYYVIPGDVELDAKPSYELTAAERAASAHGRNMDIVRLDTLWSGAKAGAANEVDYVAGTTDIEEALLNMIQKADEQNMLDDGERFLIVRPEQRKELLGVANFVQADRYGSNISVVSGELGSLYGVRVVVTNLAGTEAAAAGGIWGDGKMILCHRESLGFAFHRQPTHDMDKAIQYGAGSMAHTWDIKYGLTALQDGDLIIRAYDVV